MMAAGCWLDNGWSLKGGWWRRNGIRLGKSDRWNYFLTLLQGEKRRGRWLEDGEVIGFQSKQELGESGVEK